VIDPLRPCSMSSSASKMSSLTGVYATVVVQQSYHLVLLGCFAEKLRWFKDALLIRHVRMMLPHVGHIGQPAL